MHGGHNRHLHARGGEDAGRWCADSAALSQRLRQWHDLILAYLLRRSRAGHQGNGHSREQQEGQGHGQQKPHDVTLLAGGLQRGFNQDAGPPA